MDKEALLGRNLKEETEEYEIPGVGVITIRGLSRAEFLYSSTKFPNDTLKQERYNLSRAVVDPVLTEDDVKTWQEVSGVMEINNVAMAVNRLSGIGEGSEKEQYKSDGGSSGD